MTNQEIICTFMELKPEGSPTVPSFWASLGGWWVSFESRWVPVLSICPPIELLGRLHLVEDRLTEEQRAQYLDLMIDDEAISGYFEFGLIHATPEQKIKALGPVLLPLVEANKNA